MSGVTNNIGYTNSDGIRTICRVSFMTYNTITLTELEQYVGCH